MLLLALVEAHKAQPGRDTKETLFFWQYVLPVLLYHQMI